MPRSWRRPTKGKTRPIKQACARKRRLKVQKKRLVAAGFDPKALAKMNTMQIRDNIKKTHKKRQRVISA